MYKTNGDIQEMGKKQIHPEYNCYLTSYVFMSWGITIVSVKFYLVRPVFVVLLWHKNQTICFFHLCVIVLVFLLRHNCLVKFYKHKGMETESETKRQLFGFVGKFWKGTWLCSGTAKTSLGLDNRNTVFNLTKHCGLGLKRKKCKKSMPFHNIDHVVITWIHLWG